VTHVTGLLEGGSDGRIDFAKGTLNVGQAMPVPVITALLANYLPVSDERTVVIDSSPGTSCPMVEAVGSSDYVILVTEPTPFGLHDLKAAVEVVVGELGLPAGVIINRDGIGNSDVEHYCGRQGLPLLSRIPMDRRIAEILSDGIPLIRGLPEYRDMFIEILDTVRESVR
jgi:MinD superfamily P-loop ATPase